MNSDFYFLGFAIAIFIAWLLFMWRVEYPEKMSKCIAQIGSMISHIIGIILTVLFMGGVMGILICGWKHLWDLF